MSDANPIDEGKEVAMKVEGGEEIMRGIRGQGEGDQAGAGRKRNRKEEKEERKCDAEEEEMAMERHDREPRVLQGRRWTQTEMGKWGGMRKAKARLRSKRSRRRPEKDGERR